MTNRELQDTLAMLELVSSVLAIQLLLQSRFNDDGGEALLIDNNRADNELLVRFQEIECRLNRVERWLGIR